MSNNYKPTKWLGGKTIGTAQVMNNIEQGISNAHDRLDSVDSDIIDINDILNVIQQPEQSLRKDGYIKLPGGLILQWGCAFVDGLNGSQITFPKKFTTPEPVITISPMSIELGTTAQSAWVTGLNQYNFYARCSSETNCAWLAVGY